MRLAADSTLGSFRFTCRTTSVSRQCRFEYYATEITRAPIQTSTVAQFCAKRAAFGKETNSKRKTLREPRNRVSGSPFLFAAVRMTRFRGRTRPGRGLQFTRNRVPSTSPCARATPLAETAVSKPFSGRVSQTKPTVPNGAARETRPSRRTRPRAGTLLAGTVFAADERPIDSCSTHSVEGFDRGRSIIIACCCSAALAVDASRNRFSPRASVENGSRRLTGGGT